MEDNLGDIFLTFTSTEHVGTRGKTLVLTGLVTHMFSLFKPTPYPLHLSQWGLDTVI